MKIEMSDEDALAAINKPPSFESQIQKTFIIEHVKQADGEIEDTSVFKYTSSGLISHIDSSSFLILTSTAP